MDYPGHVVVADDPDATLIQAVRDQLGKRGFPAEAHDDVDAATAFASAVSHFQSTHVDPSGRPLQVDGKVGPNSWAALFGPASVVSGIAGKALAIAQTQVGVMEDPPNSNGGPQVTPYLASVGLGPGQSWCMAFVHWCFVQAAAGGANPSPKSGGVLDVLHRVQAAAPQQFIAKAAALADPALVKPGCIFILDHGGGLGHTGFVKGARGAGLDTIEGNSNNNGSREGVGVFEMTRRSMTDAQLAGFIDFSL